MSSKRKINHSFPTIVTDRFVMREIVSDDQPFIYQGLSHPEVIRYYGISFEDLEATKEQMDWFERLKKEETGIWWAICSKTDHSFLGAGGLNDIDHTHRKAEVGFWLLPQHWGKGIMRETMPEILKYGFGRLNLHRIEGFVEHEWKRRT
ncbi:GNAT family N-acetyltransferase [Flagellimonas lutaonensis]|uniref:GNAT family acetyltransferase n=1 Tax=Flagellimonas lutaonensis TaxID=516051 RepID=A0A0D5YW81_9FLAO|nr:GNAT family N-acetyltransferase [Allomuricauda lutaonensis]AKA36108.1 GNAT family acetyltransferase [Allomuricauda lutaonensis]